MGSREWTSDNRRLGSLVRRTVAPEKMLQVAVGGADQTDLEDGGGGVVSGDEARRLRCGAAGTNLRLCERRRPRL